MVLFQSAEGRKRTRVSESVASCMAPLSLTLGNVVHVAPPSRVNCQVPLPVSPVTAMPLWLPLVSNTWPATMSDTSTPARCAALAHGGGLPPGTLLVQSKSSYTVSGELAPLSTGARLTITLTVKVAVSTPPLAVPPLSFAAKEKAWVPSAPTP